MTVRYRGKAHRGEDQTDRQGTEQRQWCFNINYLAGKRNENLYGSPD